MAFQTDLEIRTDTDALLIECYDWAVKTAQDKRWGFDLSAIKDIGTTRFLYLKDKLLNHSPRFYRDKEIQTKGKGGTYEIKEG